MKKFYPGDVFVCVEHNSWVDTKFSKGDTIIIMEKCSLYPAHTPPSIEIFHDQRVITISAWLFDHSFVPLSLINFPKRKL